MAKKLKLSPWNDGSVKPAHVGWYKCKGSFCEGNIVWRKWAGGYWMWRDIYNNNKLARAGFSNTDQWRGVLK